MFKEPILTVIVPVGNLHGKLDNLSSWLSEVYKYELTVILVASTKYPDTCQAIVSLLNEVDISKKCKLIVGNYDNPGTSRNMGLVQAKSEWIAFWDADDIPHIQNILNELNLEKTKQVDFIIGSYRIIDSKSKSRNSVINGRDLSENELRISQNPGIWRWVFRRSALSQVFFPENRMGEDQVFLARTQFWSKKKYFSEALFYDYFTNQSGQLTSNRDAISDLFQSLDLIIDLEKQTNQMSLKHMCFKMAITLLKKSKRESKIKAVWILLKLCKRNGLMQSIGILIILIFSRRMK